MTAGIEVRDRFVTLNGLRFHYREWGAPNALPLLLVHGSSGFAQTWDAVAAHLADRWHIIAPDLRGHGESAWAADYALDRFVQDIEQLADHACPAPLTLVGASLGAMIGLHYAARFPERVVRLVLGDIGPDAFTLPAVDAIQERLSAATAEVFDEPEEAIAAVIAAAPPTTPSDALRARTAMNLVQGADGRWRWRYDGARFVATLAMGAAQEAAAWQALAQVRCPTLVIRGESSPILGRETAERMVRTLADGRCVELPASGHGLTLDNLAGYLSVLEPFLLGHAGIGGGD